MDAVSALTESLGSNFVISDPDITESYGLDWTGRFKGNVLCVVRPVSAWQVQRVIEIARASGVPVVPQGGNTGLVGGSVPSRRAIVVSSSALKGIEVDPISRIAKVGAGVTLAELDSHASRFNLKFAVDLGSRDSATLGGMVATNAGGIHLIKHGGTRQQLLGVEAVFGSGKQINRMEGLHKDNTGYDWASIICGSEGTLAFITKVAVKLIGIPAHRSVALISLETLSGAIHLMNDIRSIFGQLDAIEFMSGKGIELVAKLGGPSWPMGEIPPYALLVELAGDDVEVEALAEYLEEHSEVVDAALAYDSRADGLWRWREQITIAIGHEGIPHKLDVTIPINEISRFVSTLGELLESEYPKVRSVIFGHLGDGNVHVNLLGAQETDLELDHEVLAMAASSGGSISAEHGIGRAKVDDLSLTRSPQDIEAMRALKRLLDPSLIMNPGVILAEQ